MTDKELKSFNAGKAMVIGFIEGAKSKGIAYDEIKFRSIKRKIGGSAKNRILVIQDPGGIIIGGDVPKSLQGKTVKEGFKHLKRETSKAKKEAATKKEGNTEKKSAKGNYDTPHVLRERPDNPNILSDFNKAKGLEQQWKVMDNASDDDLKKLEKEWQSKYPGPVVNLPGLMLADREKTRAEWNKPRGHEATLNQYRENHNKEVRKLLEKDPKIRANEKAFKETMTELIQKGDFAVRVHGDTVRKILDSHFKNVYELPSNKAEEQAGNVGDNRRLVSKELFGKDEKAIESAPQEQEKYGFLDVHEDRLDPVFYGGAKIKLKKDRLMDSTTYTLGDSLQNTRDKIGSGSVKNPSVYEGVRDKNQGGRDVEELVTRYKDGTLSEFDNFEYIELQYHGDLRPSDIESIELDSVARSELSPFDLYRLKSMGIDIQLK